MCIPYLNSIFFSRVRNLFNTVLLRFATFLALFEGEAGRAVQHLPICILDIHCVDDVLMMPIMAYQDICAPLLSEWRIF